MIKKKLKKIIEEGKRIETEYFKLYLKKGDFKIGFLVNSKIGNPVKRNRVKRIIREILRKNFKKGDFLFVLKKEIIDKKRFEIENVFERIKNEIFNFIN